MKRKIYFFVCVLSQLIFLLNLFGQPSKVYYSQYHELNRNIYRCDLDGSNEITLITTDIRPKAIAIDGESVPKQIYIGLVPTSGIGKIIRYNIDGTNPVDVVTNVTGVNDIELDLVHRKIYWLKNTYSNDGVFKADMDSTNAGIEQIYSNTSVNVDLWGLALDVNSEKLWITERGGTYNSSYVKRMTFSGGAVTVIMNPAYNPHDIEYYNGKIVFG